MKNTFQQPSPQQAAELYKEAVETGADYSAKVAARQLAFARNLAKQHKDFSWEKFLSAPADSMSAEAPAEYMTFARELAEDFAQASGRSFDLWERTVVNAAENARNFLPPQAESYGRQWVSGVKTASAAFKESMRASCNAAGLFAAADSPESGRKTNGKK